MFLSIKLEKRWSKSVCIRSGVCNGEDELRQDKPIVLKGCECVLVRQSIEIVLPSRDGNLGTTNSKCVRLMRVRQLELSY